MFDMQKMMKKAQEMQNKMSAVQEELNNMEITGKAGGGAVVIVSNGKYEFRSVKIASDAPVDDAGMMEDLVLAALKDLNAQISKIAEDKMGQITAGMNIPGLKLPGF